MSIHTLQDLCYAYRVADPVREKLFALQDRIDALEAQRKPLTDERVYKMWDDKYRSWIGGEQFESIARAIEAAHNIKEGT